MDDSLQILFSLFSHKLLILETRFNALLGDIDKVLEIKQTFPKLKLN